MTVNSVNDLMLVEKIKSLSYESDVFKSIQHLILKRSFFVPLKLDVLNKTVCIDNKRLKLTGQEKIYRLFMFFCSSPGCELSRDDLLRKLYLSHFLMFFL